MFCGVPLTLLKLWEILNYPLHIFYGFELSLALFVVEKFLDQVVDVFSHLAEVLVHYLLEEFVVIARQHYFPHIFRDCLNPALQVNSVIANSKDFMYHCLVSPLVEQGCDWVLSSIQYQQDSRWTVLARFADELAIVAELSLDFLGQAIA